MLMEFALPAELPLSMYLKAKPVSSMDVKPISSEAAPNAPQVTLSSTTAVNSPTASLQAAVNA
jgi:hypothetical protein